MFRRSTVSGGSGVAVMPGGLAGGANTMSYDYTGSYTATLTADGTTETSDGESIDASSSDHNAVLSTNGGTLTITNGTLTKSGDSDNADNNNFYGTNSIALVVGEDSTTVISGSELSASSSGSNGEFDTSTSWTMA